MKKLTHLLFLSCVLMPIQAQNSHKLTLDRNAYRAADQMVKQQVEFKDPGSSGRNLTWDFSMLQALNEEYKLDYFIPDSLQMNRLCGMEHNTRYYYLQQADSLWAVGFENSTTFMNYTKPELKLRFPFTYGDTLFSHFIGEGEYCHRDSLHLKGYTRVIADAEGELKLPQSESVKKALRLRTLRHYTETGKDSMEMTLDTYAWYAEGIRYPVFESVKTTLSKKGDKKDELGESMKDTTVFSTSFYYPPEKQVSQIQTDPIPSTPADALTGAAAIFTEANWQPNPVVDNMTISYKLTRPAIIWFSVNNNAGIPLCLTSPSSKDQGFNSATIHMGGLITGLYTLNVHVDDMMMKMNVVKK